MCIFDCIQNKNRMEKESVRPKENAQIDHQDAGLEGKQMLPPQFRLTSSVSGEDAPGNNGGAPATSQHANSHESLQKAEDGPATIDVSYSVPLVKENLQVSPSETTIFGVVASDTGNSGNEFETQYSLEGSAEFDKAGSALKAVTRQGLRSTNVYVVIGDKFTSGTVTVKAVIYNKTTKKEEKTITWGMVPREANPPTGLEKVKGPDAATWTAAPGIYTYKATPDKIADKPAQYQGHTVLERFGEVDPLGFVMDDVKDEWKKNNPDKNTPERVARFLWATSGNGTFVFNSANRIADQHNGFGDFSPFKAEAIDRAEGIGYRRHQEYVIGANVIGKCKIDRKYNKADGIQIKKTDPVL